MTEYDVLHEFSINKITEDDACAILSKVLSSDPTNVEKRLILSRYEWTAYCHGASLKEVSLWRYSGWPTKCANCGRLVDVLNYGWRVVQVGDDSKLRHIVCPE